MEVNCIVGLAMVVVLASRDEYYQSDDRSPRFYYAGIKTNSCGHCDGVVSIAQKGTPKLWDVEYIEGRSHAKHLR